VPPWRSCVRTGTTSNMMAWHTTIDPLPSLSASRGVSCCRRCCCRSRSRSRCRRMLRSHCRGCSLFVRIRRIGKAPTTPTTPVRCQVPPRPSRRRIRPQQRSVRVAVVRIILRKLMPHHATLLPQTGAAGGLPAAVYMSPTISPQQPPHHNQATTSASPSRVYPCRLRSQSRCRNRERACADALPRVSSSISRPQSRALCINHTSKHTTIARAELQSPPANSSRDRCAQTPVGRPVMTRSNTHPSLHIWGRLAALGECPWLPPTARPSLTH
jgi:hypothetical protein